MGYQAEHRKSIGNPEDFWGKQAEEIDWFEFPKTILSQDSN
ncbi:MAG: acetyl-coenzyme A synthetase N-terminal domain-containing protein, partial [SAR324 cluster bacterium]|nr:acetyl-coenzyme A synthetase N-terminal domain-containing protein [SAR324 cluster bacterium]